MSSYWVFRLQKIIVVLAIRYFQIIIITMGKNDNGLCIKNVAVAKTQSVCVCVSICAYEFSWDLYTQPLISGDYQYLWVRYILSPRTRDTLYFVSCALLIIRVRVSFVVLWRRYIIYGRIHKILPSSVILVRWTEKRKLFERTPFSRINR